MSRDPFDEMQKRNPVSRDEMPMAPMSVAERILGHRSQGAMPGWAMAAAAAFVVAAVGGGLLLFLTGGEANLPVGSGGTTTTTEELASTTVVTPVAVDGAVYFFVDQVGDGWEGGPFLVPVQATLAVGEFATSSETTLDHAAAAMTRLLEGVGDEAISASALSSAIPAGTRLLGVAIEEATGIVIVDLSSEFVSGGGSASMIGRVGQVVYTLTRIDDVFGVRFQIDGVSTTVFGGEGLIIDDPATRAGFDGLLPAVMIESPAYGGEPTSRGPLVVSGTANVFEATVTIELLDGSGAVLFEGFATATCGTGCRGEWEAAVAYDTSGISQAGEWGTLRAFESSAEDGRPTNVREHPLWLHGDAEAPGSTTIPTDEAECSGSLAGAVLAQQDGLPDAVAAKRAAIWNAAVECDWDQLQSLLGPSFAYSYGGQDDSVDAPINFWQGLEEDGEDPIRFLAELLSQPFGILENQDITYYVWPSVHTKPWEDVTDAERESLRPLFDEADFADFEAFGAYYHYRIGILANGDWVYFIAGD
ncbi:MAG: Gmad2 immunoglobulin-like domain-containing protein [Acidimicrobiia bacterium]